MEHHLPPAIQQLPDRAAQEMSGHRIARCRLMDLYVTRATSDERRWIRKSFSVRSIVGSSLSASMTSRLGKHAARTPELHELVCKQPTDLAGRVSDLRFEQPFFQVAEERVSSSDSCVIRVHSWPHRVRRRNPVDDGIVFRIRPTLNDPPSHASAICMLATFSSAAGYSK